MVHVYFMGQSSVVIWALISHHKWPFDISSDVHLFSADIYYDRLVITDARAIIFDTATL